MSNLLRQIRRLRKDPGLIINEFNYQSRKPVYNIIKKAVERRSPTLVALSLLIATRPLRGHWFENNKKPTLLVLPKHGLTQDVKSAFPSSKSKVRVLTLPRRFIKSIAWEFLPKDAGDLSYVDTVPPKKREEYKDFLKETMDVYMRFIKIDGILSANYVYYAERELAGAMSELNSKFIVLQKEHNLTPALKKMRSELYSSCVGEFTGTDIAFYSKDTEEMFISSGLTTPDKTEVVGCPRIDEYHKIRKNNISPNKKTLTLFSFRPEKGTGHRYGDIDNIRFKELSADTHLELLKFSQEFSEYSVIIKVKDNHNMNYLSELFDQHKVDIPSNVTITQKMSPYKLIKDSKLIISFNSTTILEALAANRKIVYPKFAEANSNCYPEKIMCLPDSIHQPKSKSEYFQSVHSIMNGKKRVNELNDSEIETLENYVSNSDGKSGERFQNFIYRVLN